MPINEEQVAKFVELARNSDLKKMEKFLSKMQHIKFPGYYNEDQKQFKKFVNGLRMDAELDDKKTVFKGQVSGWLFEDPYYPFGEFPAFIEAAINNNTEVISFLLKKADKIGGDEFIEEMIKTLFESYNFLRIKPEAIPFIIKEIRGMKGEAAVENLFLKKSGYLVTCAAAKGKILLLEATIKEIKNCQGGDELLQEILVKDEYKIFTDLLCFGVERAGICTIPTLLSNLSEDQRKEAMQLLNDKIGEEAKISVHAGFHIFKVFNSAFNGKLEELTGHFYKFRRLALMLPINDPLRGELEMLQEIVELDPYGKYLNLRKFLVVTGFGQSIKNTLTIRESEEVNQLSELRNTLTKRLIKECGGKKEDATRFANSAIARLLDGNQNNNDELKKEKLVWLPPEIQKQIFEFVNPLQQIVDQEIKKFQELVAKQQFTQNEQLDEDGKTVEQQRFWDKRWEEERHSAQQEKTIKQEEDKGEEHNPPSPSLEKQSATKFSNCGIGKGCNIM